jgi:acyl carrier protein
MLLAVPAETAEERVERLVCEYAESVPAARPLDTRLSLRDDLAIESLSLVSLTVRMADELGVQLDELDLELGEVKTIGDLVRVARTLSRVGDESSSTDNENQSQRQRSVSP